ncbi:TetR/AcrR family transcriptional regulator [Streptomyces sp. NPDC097619]|uniref:TetR/AcrR family transcriptional regulator n=1 Tax=Streptomyces sp. NPDC097619 TaxID=3157228 RepID=UPI00333454B4
MGTGRPRGFDLDEGLDRAMRVFWRQGYEGAGLADLTEAMGISRPSLYAAYGNKEELFRKAVRRYEEGPARHHEEALSEPTAHAVVARLLRGVVEVTSVPDGTGPGCMVVQSALATSAAGAAVREELAERRRQGERRLRERLERARDEGDLPADRDPELLARQVCVLSYGLAVQAATGTPRADLTALVDLTLAAWPPPTTAS